MNCSQTHPIRPIPATGGKRSEGNLGIQNWICKLYCLQQMSSRRGGVTKTMKIESTNVILSNKTPHTKHFRTSKGVPAEISLNEEWEQEEQEKLASAFWHWCKHVSFHLRKERNFSSLKIIWELKSIQFATKSFQTSKPKISKISGKEQTKF